MRKHLIAALALVVPSFAIPLVNQLGFAPESEKIVVIPGNDANPFEVRDMAGNTWDWTSTVREARNGAERGRLVNVVKGGSWYANRTSCLPGFEGEGRAASGRYNTVGFRLVAAE